MKKFVCLLVAMMLCMSAAALAAPSKTTSDFTWVTMPEEVPAPELSVTITNPAQNAACEEVLADLSASIAGGASAAEFFGEVKNSAGETVKIEEILGTADVKVAELVPLVVENFDGTYENVTVNVGFATPFVENEKVVLLVGIETINADGAKSVEWILFEGIGKANGSVDVTFDKDTLLAIQNGTAMMAVIQG